MRNSVASAPRSTEPPISGSALSSFDSRAAPSPLASRGRAAAEQKVDLFVDFVGERLERHHAGLADGRRNPAGDAQAACGRGASRRKSPRSRGNSRKPDDARHGGARLGIGSKIEMLALLRHVVDRDRHVPWHRAGRLRSDVQACAKVSGLGKTALPADKASSGWASNCAPPRAHSAQAAPHCHRHPTQPKILRASAFSSSCVDRPRREPRHRRPAGRKRLRRNGASRAARRDRRCPFRAGCGRGRGKKHRTIAVRRPSRAERRGVPGGCGLLCAEPAQNQHEMQHDQLETPFDAVGNPIVRVESRRASLRHDSAIESMDIAIVVTTPKSP